MSAGSAAAALLLVAGCGGGERQDAHEPNRTYPVEVSQASFPLRQSLSQHSRMVIRVRNAGTRTIPDVAVTIGGQRAQAFAYRDPQPGLADPSRPIWVVDAPPGGGKPGGPGGAVTAYTNTWALGPLAPGATKTFVWSVTAVRSGRYLVTYQVAAGLNGRAKARLAGGAIPQGQFAVHISDRPRRATVNDAGQVVYR